VIRPRTAAASTTALVLGLSWALTPPPAAADPGTVFTMDTPSVLEGDSGTTDLVFTISITGTPLTSNASVDYFTNNAGGADAPGDFALTSGTLTFTPGGPTSQQVVVKVVGDTWHEDDETVPVTMDDPVNGVVGQAIHDGTILNDDGEPTISLGDAVTSESGTLGFPITLSNLSQDTVTVDYATVAGTADEGSDFVVTTGTMVFQATFASQIGIVTVGDLVEEPTEDMTVVLSNPVGGTILDGTGIGTILDDDAPPGPPGPPDEGPEGPEPPDKGFPGLPALPEIDETTTTTTATTTPAVVPAGDPATTSSTTATTAAPAATVAARSTGGGTLARTGSSSSDLAVVGVGAVLLGFLVVRRAGRARAF
jgi:hypothetical protein